MINMSSKKNNFKANAKIKNFFKRIKNVILVKDSDEEKARIEKLNVKEKKEALKQRKRDTIIVLGTMILISVCIIIGSYQLLMPKSKSQNGLNNPSEIREQNSTLKEEKINEMTIIAPITSKCMVDTMNNIYLKIAMTRLDTKVAYSVTYNNDSVPEGKLSNITYFTGNNITSVLTNGYPIKSVEELGVQDEEEAYIATQIAVYEVISRNQIAGISNGKFSIDALEPIEEAQREKVERIKKSALEIVDLAVSNSYGDRNVSSLNKVPAKYFEKDGKYFYGPMIINSENDEITKLIVKDEKPLNNITVNSLKGNAVVVNEEFKETSDIKLGENFYIKFDSLDEYFVDLTVQINHYSLQSKIYASQDSTKKKYVLLDKTEVANKNVVSLYKNVDIGTLDIDFLNTKGEEIKSGYKYKIYNQDGKLIHDVNGAFKKDEKWTLPLGKYYVQEYKIGDKYLLNNNKYEVNITKKDEEVNLKIINESLR